MGALAPRSPPVRMLVAMRGSHVTPGGNTLGMNGRPQAPASTRKIEKKGTIPEVDPSCQWPIVPIVRPLLAFG